ncbi:MAG: hypothetical protein EA397_06105 [Deltaproteobacteria bacterium]|nr:MAG: hypothetical protein EA397_06105 [Deltaproteobacteria bacterium]
MTVLRLDQLVQRVQDRAPLERAQGPFVGLEHIVPGQLRLAHVGEAGSQRSVPYRFQKGDLLFGALRPGLRKVVLAREAGVCSTELLVLRPRDDAGAGLALAALAHPATLLAAQRLATGTRMPRVRWSALRALKVRLPPPTERQRIDRLLLLLHARLEILHRQQALRAELLTAMTEAHRCSDAPPLADIADIIGGRPSPVSQIGSGDPIYGVADLPAEGLEIDRYASERPQTGRRRVRRGDILVSLLRPKLRKVGLCPLDGWVSAEVAVVRPRPGWLGAVLGTVRSRMTQEPWIQQATGARMPRFSLRQLRATPCLLDHGARATLRHSLDTIAQSILQAGDHGRCLRRAREEAIGRLIHPATERDSRCVGQADPIG